MLKLIRNEYQKIFSKIGTYTMFGLAIAICIFYQIIMIGTADISEYWKSTEESVREELESYQEFASKASDSETEALAEYNFYIDFYTKMLELGVYDAEDDSKSWRGDALNRAYFDYYAVYKESFDSANTYTNEEKAKAKENYDTIIALVEENDFHKYCQAMLEILDDDDSDREYFSIILEYDIESGSWQEDAASTMVSCLENMERYESYELSDFNKSYQKSKAGYLIAKYRIEHNIQYCVTDAFDDSYSYIFYSEAGGYDFDSLLWKNLYSGASMVTLAGVIIIILAGGIIAREFSQGTIKFLLINPVTRRKIFFSKYITLFSLMLITSAVMFGSMFVTNLVMGVDGMNCSYLEYSNGAVLAHNILGFVLLPWLLNFIGCGVIITMAMMISSCTRSSAMAIGICIGVLMIGNTATTIMAAYGLDFGRYFVFANTGLNSIMLGNSSFSNHSLRFALVNIALHWIVFLLTAYDGFTRKEV